MKKALLILMSIIIFGCSKDDNSPTEPIEQNLTVESNNVKTFEVVSVAVNNLELTNNTYQATFGNSEITLVKFDDNTLIFSVPEIGQGTYTLSLSLGTIEFNVTETQVSNTDEIIQNVFDNFSTNIGNLDNSDPFIANEITEAESYNTEVLALYNSLNAEQKRQTAMFYEANKEVFKNFKNDIALNLNGPTTLSRIPQSECFSDYNLKKEFYSCTAENLGNSAIALKNSSKEFLQILALAGASAYLAPASFGLSAVGTFLGLGTAAYIFMTEVRPPFIQFYSSLKAFVFSNWILTQATFSVVADEFASESEASLNVTPDFRSMNSNDSGVSQETSFFINSLNTLNAYWNQLTALFGNTISYQDTSENVDFDDNTDQITITNISNSNVELVSVNGQNVIFKSLSGNDETFSYDVQISKEGFTEISSKTASITTEDIHPSWATGSWFRWHNQGFETNDGTGCWTTITRNIDDQTIYFLYYTESFYRYTLLSDGTAKQRQPTQGCEDVPGDIENGTWSVTNNVLEIIINGELSFQLNDFNENNQTYEKIDAYSGVYYLDYFQR